MQKQQETIRFVATSTTTEPSSGGVVGWSPRASSRVQMPAMTSGSPSMKPKTRVLNSASASVSAGVIERRSSPSSITRRVGGTISGTQTARVCQRLRRLHRDLACEVRSQLPAVERLAEVVALSLLAAELPEVLDLVRSLDPLRHHLQA